MVDPTAWHSQRNQAIQRRHRGDFVGAIANMEEAISRTRGVADLADETGTMLNYLADIYLCEGLFDRAETTIREALQLEGARRPVEYHSYINDLLILAKVLHKTGRHDEALGTAQESLRLVRTKLNRDPYYMPQVTSLVRELRTASGTDGFAWSFLRHISAPFLSLKRFILKPRQ